MKIKGSPCFMGKKTTKAKLRTGLVVYSRSLHKMALILPLFFFLINKSKFINVSLHSNRTNILLDYVSNLAGLRYL